LYKYWMPEVSRSVEEFRCPGQGSIVGRNGDGLHDAPRTLDAPVCDLETPVMVRPVNDPLRSEREILPAVPAEVLPPVAANAHSEQHDSDDRSNRHDPLLRLRKCSVRDGAKLVGVSESKMRNMINEGKIPVLAIEGQQFLLERDLERYLRDNYVFIRPAETRIQTSRRLPDEIEQSDVLAPLRRGNGS
jgi:excisionase family DNA binding protein